MGVLYHNNDKPYNRKQNQSARSRYDESNSLAGKRVLSGIILAIHLLYGHGSGLIRHELYDKNVAWKIDNHVDTTGVELAYSA